MTTLDQLKAAVRKNRWAVEELVFDAYMQEANRFYSKGNHPGVSPIDYESWIYKGASEKAIQLFDSPKMSILYLKQVHGSFKTVLASLSHLVIEQRVRRKTAHLHGSGISASGSQGRRKR